MFNQKYLDDHDVIERYLADQLPEAEREGFEAYFLQHPEVVQQMNRTAKFKAALMDLNESGRLQPLLIVKGARNRLLKLLTVASLFAIVLVVLAWLIRR